MSTFAVTMVKNEEDIIVPVVRHMLAQVDYVIVADNMSTDSTKELLLGIGDDRLEVIDDLDPAYYQSRKMTQLALMATRKGAKWIVPFDADEVWYSPFGLLKDVLGAVPEDIAIVLADLYDHVPTALDDESDGNPITRVKWRRREKGALSKVACRASEALVIDQGNHGASHGGFRLKESTERLVVRHFPYRSKSHMWKKAQTGNEALEHTDLPDSSGSHWRGYARLGEEAVGKVFEEWFWAVNPYENPTLILDPAPISN